jgi:uncharacterized protein
MTTAGLNTTPTDAPAFEGSIGLPYKLTAGRAAAAFVAELASHRIVGSSCPGCGRTSVPAQDFCGRCGAESSALLEMPAGGTISAFTETANGVLALIRIDGSDTDMAHRILDTPSDELELGGRVEARWAEEASGTMLDLAGFALSDADASGEPKELEPSAEPVLVRPYELHLSYQHAYGPYYGRLFDELSTSRRILGSRCPSCERVLVPPRALCESCFVRTGEWVDASDSGVLKSFSVIHIEFVGQSLEPPYVYAEIVLDGSNTRLIHTVGEIDPEEAPQKLAPGTRVQAVWRDAPPSGTLEDIAYFKVADEA